MDYLDRIVNIYKEEENDYINDYSLETVKTAALYMFYHYYNADTTKLDEMNNQFCFLSGDVGDIIALNNNYYEDNTIDFITVLPEAYFIENDSCLDEAYEEFLNEINKIVASIVLRNGDSRNEYIVNKLNEYEIDDKTTYNVFILCNRELEIESKIKFQKITNNHISKNRTITFKVLFKDDILEVISDIETPKNSVLSSSLRLFDSNITTFGKEKSFLCFISAKSLKENYYQYSTRGLFASNLRYYVKSIKIDSQIIKTINEEPENFCYYNNGIIITCDDYKIEDDTIKLKNFSIVNGGQTTNLIGMTPFDRDFGVMCKVIKNKYENQYDKVDFLSKVAEASNTQKPIKAKDLIANRKEQRLLKIQYEKANMFLQVKRGEKIPKDIYSEPWQNAANDQVAQMLYSTIYQYPGASKNAKSKLLENEKIYKKLFLPTYNSYFLVSLQHIKVGFNNWVKKLKKEEKHGSTKLGLAKHGDCLTFGVIGLIYKLLTNESLYNEIMAFNVNELTSENEDLRFLLSQNDIGDLNLLNKNFINNIGKNSFFEFFELIYENVLIPSYERFRKKYPTYSYGNFSKSDYYYFNYAVPVAINYLKKNIKLTIFSEIYDLSKMSSTILERDESFSTYKPGLEIELIEYRSRTYRSSNVPAYEIFKNNQLVLIIRFKLRTIEDLKRVAKFSDLQCEKYGETICKIVSKYCDLSDYMSE